MKHIKTYGRVRLPDNLRRKIFKRDGEKCVKCGSNEALTIDHIIPVSLGGSNRENNLITLCFLCNQKKGVDIYPEFIRI